MRGLFLFIIAIAAVMQSVHALTSTYSCTCASCTPSISSLGCSLANTAWSGISSGVSGASSSSINCVVGMSSTVASFIYPNTCFSGSAPSSSSWVTQCQGFCSALAITGININCASVTGTCQNQAVPTTTTTAPAIVTANNLPCPVTSWSQWTSCQDTSCQSGSETRVRTLVNAANAGSSQCPELYQTRCVTGDCYQEAYMTVNGGDFVLSVPTGGSMTFIEANNVWTFSDVANNAQSYTDSQVAATASTAAAQINAAFAMANSVSSTSVAALNSQLTSSITSQVANAVSTSKSYTDSNVAALSTSVAAQSTSASQLLSTAVAQDASSIEWTRATLTQQTSSSTSSQAAALASQSSSLTTSITNVQSQATGIRNDLTTTQGNFVQLNATVYNSVMSSITSHQSSITATASIAAQQTSAQSTAAAAALNSQASTLASTATFLGGKTDATNTNLASTQMSLAALSMAVANSVTPSISTAQYSVNALSSNLTPRVSTLENTVNVNVQSRLTLQESYTLNPRLSNVESTITSNLQPRTSTLESTVGNTLTPQMSTAMSRLTYSENSAQCKNSDLFFTTTTNTCVARLQYAYTRYFSEVYYYNQVWSDIPGRTFTFTKLSQTSVLQIVYSDVVGFYNPSNNNISPGCRWRMLLDGTAYTKASSSHSDYYYGWRAIPITHQYHVPNIPAGQHTIEMQVQIYQGGAGASQCLAGWSNGNIENSISVREIARANITFNTMMTDVRTSATSWGDILGRSVTFVKQSSNTDLWITYDDNMGMNIVGQGDAADWRLSMDGGATLWLANRFYGYATSGWWIMPTTLLWLGFNIPAGSHTFTLQNIMYGAANQLLQGWPDGDTHNSFAIEERVRGSITYSSGFSDQRWGSPSWNVIPDRLVVHTKLNDSTALRVTYYDTVGFLGTGSQTTTFRIRLLVDGGVAGSLEYWAICSSTGGWRIFPAKMHFYPIVGHGSHTYQIQWIMGAGASSLLAGYPGGATTNYLIVEELFPSPTV